MGRARCLQPLLFAPECPRAGAGYLRTAPRIVCFDSSTRLAGIPNARLCSIAEGASSSGELCSRSGDDECVGGDPIRR